MNSRFVLATIASLALAVCASADTTLTGTVTDADGKPVAGVEVGTNWQLGAEVKAYDGVKTGEDGTFTLNLKYYRPPVALIAFDAARERGAAAVVADAAKPQPLRLAPLAAVKGELACTDASLSPAGASLQWQFGTARAGNLHATDLKWSTKLPPGAWSFWISHRDMDSLSKKFEAVSGKTLDLGLLKVAPTALAMLMGKEFPAWTLSDARGVAKTAQPAGYRGKWVLIEFWGFW
ncbi:MAG: hypothetical protein FD180_1436 [Planctomycetota bacterium]|nr:MAG: hypothetical protein FD180_1436 [Planctomycetota bacterium]